MIKLSFSFLFFLYMRFSKTAPFGILNARPFFAFSFISEKLKRNNKDSWIGFDKYLVIVRVSRGPNHRTDLEVRVSLTTSLYEVHASTGTMQYAV